MFAVVNSDNSFSGVQYSEIKQKIIEHHQKYNQKIIWIERSLTYDEDGNVNEIPTDSELKSEITKAPKSVTEFQNRLEATEQALLQLMMEGS